ncbi:alpha/beta hydrolase [Flavobacteriaceae bacterium F89]|uniref:Alpha/beta hydrolase n=1 Tax=Cerina litoralis TaxID=2874477 RepID=A0AAE3JN56_9FLAO|nr:alpha/beta hydrolase [Cerina litoralis]MCG2459539.1 alpha/beta hydrolase [Cerina litoralis]
MKRFLWILFLGVTFSSTAQRMVLKKGRVLDSIPVAHNATDNFGLYLPKNYDASQKWPVVFVCDMKGDGLNVLENYKTSAEKQGYIFISINNLTDTLSISKNVLIANRIIVGASAIFSINPSRVYVAGFEEGARFASILPVFIGNVDGVISCGSDIGSIEILDAKNPFHYIGIVGKGDFNYTNMLQTENVLNKLKFPNQLLTFEGGHDWPPAKKLEEALEIFSLSSMVKGNNPKDKSFIEASYNASWERINSLIYSLKMLEAEDLITQTESVYPRLVGLDSLKEKLRQLKKNKIYKTQKRDENAAFNKESLTRVDYAYYLEEDVNTYNFKNLGWWSYQMDELKKHSASPNAIESQMGERLMGFLNALIQENIGTLKKEDPIDEEGLRFLWMLKTITAPKEYSNYLKVISSSAKNDDFGTALFYTEELLKKGYTNKSELYDLKDTALLRITPEFNELVAQYLKGARYELPIE